MKERELEEFTRRELVEHLLEVIEMEIWGLADGDLEELGEFLGYDVETKKHGIFVVKSLDKD